MKTTIHYAFILAVLATALSANAFSQAKKSPGFTLHGNIKGTTSAKAYLSHTYNKETITDSAIIKNGAFVFKGTAPEPLLYTLKLSDTKQQKIFFIENADMHITGERDSIFKAKVTGSPTGDLYTSFYSLTWKPVTDRAGVIYKKMDVASQKGKIKIDSVSRKQFDKEFEELGKFNDTVITAFVKQHPSSVATAVIIEDRYIGYAAPEKAAVLYALLNDKVKKSVYGAEIKKALDLDAKTGLGKFASDFTQPDTSGKPVSLHDFKGKYVLIDFWASWCAPCRAENPNVVKAYKKYHDKGFEILGVSLDNKKEAWLKAIAADGLSWNHVSDLKGWSNAAAADYGVKSVPANYLLDRDGKIIAKGLRGEFLDKKLAELLK